MTVKTTKNSVISVVLEKCEEVTAQTDELAEWLVDAEESLEAIQGPARPCLVLIRRAQASLELVTDTIEDLASWLVEVSDPEQQPGPLPMNQDSILEPKRHPPEPTEPLVDVWGILQGRLREVERRMDIHSDSIGRLAGKLKAPPEPLSDAEEVWDSRLSRLDRRLDGLTARVWDVERDLGHREDEDSLDEDEDSCEGPDTTTAGRLRGLERRLDTWALAQADMSSHHRSQQARDEAIDERLAKQGKAVNSLNEQVGACLRRLDGLKTAQNSTESRAQSFSVNHRKRIEALEKALSWAADGQTSLVARGLDTRLDDLADSDKRTHQELEALEKDLQDLERSTSVAIDKVTGQVEELGSGLSRVILRRSDDLRGPVADLERRLDELGSIPHLQELSRLVDAIDGIRARVAAGERNIEPRLQACLDRELSGLAGCWAASFEVLDKRLDAHAVRLVKLEEGQGCLITQLTDSTHLVGSLDRELGTLRHRVHELADADKAIHQAQEGLSQGLSQAGDGIVHLGREVERLAAQQPAKPDSSLSRQACSCTPGPVCPECGGPVAFSIGPGGKDGPAECMAVRALTAGRTRSDIPDPDCSWTGLAHSKECGCVEAIEGRWVDAPSRGTQ